MIGRHQLRRCDKPTIIPLQPCQQEALRRCNADICSTSLVGCPQRRGHPASKNSFEAIRQTHPKHSQAAMFQHALQRAEMLLASGVNSANGMMLNKCRACCHCSPHGCFMTELPPFIPFTLSQNSWEQKQNNHLRLAIYSTTPF